MSLHLFVRRPELLKTLLAAELVHRLDAELFARWTHHGSGFAAPRATQLHSSFKGGHVERLRSGEAKHTNPVPKGFVFPKGI